MTDSDSSIPAHPGDTAASALDRAAILHELEFYVARTMALASAGKPYPEVIAHVGAVPEQDQEELDDDEENGVASVASTSRLFPFICFRLGSGEQTRTIASMEFYAEPGAFTMDDMEAVFGPWHRIPEEDDDTLFVLAWFSRYDKSSGATMFLYADDAGKDIPIAAAHTPGRVFFTTEYARDNA